MSASLQNESTVGSDSALPVATRLGQRGLDSDDILRHIPPPDLPLRHPLAGPAAVSKPAALEFPTYAYELIVDGTSAIDASQVNADSDSLVNSPRADAITTSLKSDDVDYRFEHGRRYHAFDEGAYWLPNDEHEADRLDRQNHIWRLTLGGALHAAPVPSDAQNVLDVGTGSGIWAIEYADEHPAAQVVGTDLSAIQPERVPPNVSFVVYNAESDWDFGRKKFDFIHARMLCLGVHNWERFIHQCYAHLKPGGWLELQEVQFPIKCDDNSVTAEDALMKWSVHVHEAAAKRGIDTLASDKFSQQMKDRGFANVKEGYLKWPVGPWPKGEKQKVLGRWQFENLNRGLQGFSLALFTKVLGWSSEAFELFLVDVRKDMADRKKHYYWQITVHHAQKPSRDEV